MKLLLFKYLVTASLVVLISEVAKRNDKFGALIASLPLVTCMVLVWLYLEQQSVDKIANHARYTFWYVLPTLPMFLLFPMLMEKMGFWFALAASAIITVSCFIVLAIVAKPFGINLW
jgi:uncharacterized membrane protein (GlpM family)